jgi:alkaline phosphatase
MVHTLAVLILAATAATRPLPPKNVILLIGDGFGIGHVTLAKNVRGEKFRIGTMPVVGVFTTHCADRAVTDSAAGATALATGAKTNYEMLSLDPKTLAPLPTVLERAEEAGKATGLVTTTYFWDATPAAFAAHARHRHDPGIDAQILKSGVDVVAGTGSDKFGTEENPVPVDTLAGAHGFILITDPKQLDVARGPKLLACFPSQVRDVDTPGAELPVLTKWALGHLDDDRDGFFLVVEHEGSDGSSHQNQTADLRKVVASFDEAVGVALDFAAKRGDTLVVVAADHETGGMRISETKQLSRFRVEWSTTDHTGEAVAVFAYGPGSAAFAGFQDNTDVGRKLMDAVGGGKN